MSGPCNSVGSVEDLRKGGGLFEPSACSILFPRNDDSHCNRIHSSFIAAHCFSDRYVRKQQVPWKEYCAEHWLKETMDRFTGRHDVTEITTKTPYSQ